MPRYFTLIEAERLLPAVERSIREAIRLRSLYAETELRIQRATQRIVSLGGSIANREQFIEDRRERDAAEKELKQAIGNVQEMGCQIKDLDTGLVDFPTLYRGREVLLCWRLGEDGIHFWHSLEEGFRGRKPVDEDFLSHHRGDGVN